VGLEGIYMGFGFCQHLFGSGWWVVLIPHCTYLAFSGRVYDLLLYYESKCFAVYYLSYLVLCKMRCGFRASTAVAVFRGGCTSFGLS
jgi:hypothetical protein